MRNLRSLAKQVMAVCCTVIACGLGTAHAQQFVNGGFETDSWTQPEVQQVTISGWNVVQASSRFVAGSHNDGDLTQYNTPYGSQFIILCAVDCAAGSRGSISQTVSGFTVGAQYTLSFAQSPEVGGTSYDHLVEVTIAGAGTQSQVFATNGFGTANSYWTEWLTQTWTFTADSTSLTFTFAGTVNSDGITDIESGIDNVSIVGGTGPVGPTAIPTMPIYGLVLMMVVLVYLGSRRLRASARRG